MNRSDIIKKGHLKRIYNPQMKFSSKEANKYYLLCFLNSVFSLGRCDTIVYFLTIQKV